MNIFVFIKQVPDTASRIKIAGDGKNIDEGEITWIISPYDEFALEEALRIKEKKGSGKVVVVSMGPERAAKSLRDALAIGADEAIHLLDPALEGSDAYTTAKVLAAVVKSRPFDLLFFGKTGVGMDQTEVPSMVAEILDLPQATQVAKLEIGEGKLTAHREVEGATETVECSIPAVIAAEKGLNEPRYPSLKGIMAAKKKPLETLNLAALGLNAAEVGAQGSTIVVDSMMLPPPREAGKILKGETKDVVRELVNLLHNDAKVI